MKNRYLGLFVVMIAINLLGINTSIADTSVWKVSKGDSHLYLGGTVHVLSKSDYPLPDAFEKAYKASSVIFFETDIQKMQDPEAALSVLSIMLYDDGTTLDKVLKKETIDALKAYLKKRNLPLEAFITYRPAGLYLTLMSLELAELSMLDSGVDQYFDAQARKDKKTLGHLETFEQQKAFLAEMGKGNEDELILYGLRDLENLKQVMIEMKDTWRSGDREKYRELLLKPFMKDYPETYQSLLVKRNQNWMPKIEALFATPEIELVLVGALHMIGQDGLLQQLEKKGYRVEKHQ